MLINQAFLLFNYCTLCINISVFIDCLLSLTVMFSMIGYFWGLLYLHWLTISNEYLVSNPILLRMTPSLRRKLINQAFLLSNYCTLYINLGVFKRFLRTTFQFQNDSSLNEECLYCINTQWLFPYIYSIWHWILTISD